jgi:N-acetylmuramoyl-L-alanine amidase
MGGGQHPRVKFGFGPLLFLMYTFAIGVGDCRDTLPRPTSVWVSGHEYFNIRDWARLRKLDLRWSTPEHVLTLGPAPGRVNLRVESREAVVDGIAVWLVLPLIKKGDALLISSVDAEMVIEAVLFPPRNARQTRVQLICLDAGHGGKDPGNQVGAHEEKKYTLLLAREVGDQLKKAGLKVQFTRSSDKYVDLPDRPASARKGNADLFVSLHFNAAVTARESARGSEVFCLTPAGANSTNGRGIASDTGPQPGNRNDRKNMLLAFQMQKALVRGLGTEDRGVRRARFWVLRDAVMPAVLVEAGFMSHPTEGRKILDAQYRRQIARCIVQGVLAYKKSVEAGV